MSTKSVLPAALILSFMGWGAVRAQAPYSEAALSPVPVSTVVKEEAEAPVASPAGALSPYLDYHRPGCCGPIGGDGPIQIEIYTGGGLSFPVGSNVFGRVLDLGWLAEGGARSLFFDPAKDAAWVVDLGLVTIENHANSPKVRVPLRLAGFNTPFASSEARIAANPGVTINSLNRTFGSLGFGRDWFLGDRSGDWGPAWRIGLDAAFRYGTSKLELNEIRHRTDTLAGVAVGVHANVEVPCGASVLVGGVRGGWAYTWSDILQIQNNSDLSEFYVTVEVGVRF